jgi:hypothetical protein
MGRVYAVEINGRTLESRNLRELLARAVSAKRNPDQRKMLRSKIHGRLSEINVSGSYPQSGMTAVH